MITQSVITAVLIGIVITGVIPAIAGIALLAMRKIKATSFWAGVLAYIIAIIVYSIITLIITFSTMDLSSMSGVLETSTSTGVQAVLQIASAVCLALSMSICIICCMKKTRTFVGALSCGLGFAAAHLISAAFGFVTMYINFLNVNSGGFDQQMAMMVNAGVYSKEDVNAMREQFTGITVSDVFSSVISSAALALVFTAAAIFIMRGVCAKAAFVGMISSVLVLSAVCVSAIIPNIVAALVVMAAIGAAALIFAVRMKDRITPPEKPAVMDDFMNSVTKAKSDE